MSNRQASPPSVKYWPFFLGDMLLLAVAFGALATGHSPPGTGTMVLVAACVLLGVGLPLIPFLLEYEARLRLAEASVRDQLDHQAKRLTQATEQLSHAISRSQSTEEQAGQALGTLEELAEKLTSQADDLAQSLARANDREVRELKVEVDRLARDREEQFSALNGKLALLSTTIQEAHSATKLSIAAHARVVDDIHLRLDAIGSRVEDISKAFNHFRATAPSFVEKTPKPPTAPTSSEPAHPKTQPARVEETKHAAHPAKTSRTNAAAEAPPSKPSEAGEPRAAAAAEPGEAGLTDPTIHQPEPTASPAEKHAAKPARHETPKQNASEAPHAGPERTTPKPAKPAATEDAPELPLEGMPALRPPAKHTRRDLAGATSVVATAYIGIGNKLFVRGEGPGLTWERGVPMQFLAIGKWGWTTTDAGGPVICRIFRNDETPMLDADVIISPGEKAEITPRF
ncbi:MAG: hypothetical protein ACREIA_01495 [Opitutaceae bacterium]